MKNKNPEYTEAPFTGVMVDLTNGNVSKLEPRKSENFNPSNWASEEDFKSKRKFYKKYK